MPTLPQVLRVLSALTLGAGWGLSSGSAVGETRTMIPSFWNPDAGLPRPDLSRFGVIRFITNDNYPPFGFALADGTAAGFEVDLARALCQELKVTCTIQARPWAEIIPALKEGGGDAAMASIAIGSEPMRALAFTAPYYKTPARFIVRRGSAGAALDIPALAGKPVGVVAGTAHQAYLGSFFPGMLATPFPDAEAVRTALKAGRVDAAFGDGATWSVWLNGSDAGGCCVFAGGPYTEEKFFGRGAGIAVRPKDADLRLALDFALARVAAKGVYGDIYLRYFPVGLY